MLCNSILTLGLDPKSLEQLKLQSSLDNYASSLQRMLSMSLSKYLFAFSSSYSSLQPCDVKHLSQPGTRSISSSRAINCPAPLIGARAENHPTQLTTTPPLGLYSEGRQHESIVFCLEDNAKMAGR